VSQGARPACAKDFWAVARSPRPATHIRRTGKNSCRQAAEIVDVDHLSNLLTAPRASQPPSEASQSAFSTPDPPSAPASRFVARGPRTRPAPLRLLELPGFRPRNAKAPPGNPTRPSCSPTRATDSQWLHLAPRSSPRTNLFAVALGERTTAFPPSEPGGERECDGKRGERCSSGTQALPGAYSWLTALADVRIVRAPIESLSKQLAASTPRRYTSVRTKLPGGRRP